MKTANSRQTVASVLEANKGVTSGFDYLRIGLALAVMAWHSIIVTRGHDADIWASLWRPLPAAMLPMFFCLSGFLVAGSLYRTASIREFLTLRAVRIVPALVVEVVLSAIILGILFSALPMSEYFSSDRFYKYFMNIVGLVHFDLPGLFLDNPFPGIVNANLWTLPYELECYILLSLLMVLGFVRRRSLVLMLIALGMVWFTLHGWPQAELLQQERPQGRALVLAFLLGLAFYLFRERIVMSRTLFLVMLTASVLLLLQGVTQFLALPFLAYVTVYLGLLTPKKRGFLFRGDYSYGLYLFGFPLQQVHAHLFGASADWLGNFSFALVLGLIYAWFSWNYVEAPALRRKRTVTAWVDALWVRLAAIFGGATARAASPVPESER